MIKYVIVLAVALGMFTSGYGQQTYTLPNLVQLARSQSPAWLRAETRKENNYWRYRTYKSDYNPQLTLSGTLPNFEQRFRQVTQDDGSVVYQEFNNNNTDLQLRLNQSIGLTGATVFVNSNLNRYDDFARDNVLYNSTPVSVGFSQPIFQFNQLNWDRKIKPLEYEESQKQFFEELEEISVNTTQIFFDKLLAQINLGIAEKNVQSNDTIYKIAQGRYNLGKIGENELLQLELNLVNSNLAGAQAELEDQTATLNLKSYVGISDAESINLVLPENIPNFDIDEVVALAEARKNRQDPVAYKRRVLEGAEQVAQAKGQSGINMNLFGFYGLNDQGSTIGDVYSDPVNSTNISLQLSVPVLDWGRQKSRIRTAEANRKLIEYQVAQDEIDFDQDVITQVRIFKMLRDQLIARIKSDDIADRAYSISKQLFLIGKISITDLNQALAAKDLAKRNYVSSLRDFWVAYFLIRQKTLFDFESNTLLLRDIETD